MEGGADVAGDQGAGEADERMVIQRADAFDPKADVRELREAQRVALLPGWVAHNSLLAYQQRPASAQWRTGPRPIIPACWPAVSDGVGAG